MDDMPFVPPEFDPPQRLSTPDFVLEPLGPQHNERDYHAWTSSIDHVRATPGFRDGSWPQDMTAEENRGDLERHQRDFIERRGFTYTVLDPADGDVIGCLYIYPLKDAPGADVRSWCAPTVRPWTSSWPRASPPGLSPRGRSSRSAIGAGPTCRADDGTGTGSGYDAAVTNDEAVPAELGLALEWARQWPAESISRLRRTASTDPRGAGR